MKADKIIEDSYPLSPMQEGMLFNNLYAPGSGVDIEQIVCAVHEDMDSPLFERAWQRVMERHPALRTSFQWQGLDQPVQEVHRRIRCPLEQQDWRGLSVDEQETRLDAYLQADRRRGFELSEAPLMRLALFRWADAKYQFVWTVHHILLDGRSFPLVLKEVFAFHDAFCKGQDLHLEQPRPYRDYIEWLQQQDLPSAEAFWRQILQDLTMPTPLVGGGPPGPGRVGHAPTGETDYGVQQIQLPVALTSALQSLAQRHQLTLNTLLQGAWALLLSRYSGQEDVIFGATRACRRSALEGVGTEAMVGLFINTLPIRTRVLPETPVLPWLRELRAQSLAVREYEHTPLVKIKEWSDLPRGVPLFESILVFENYLLNSALRAQGVGWETREFRVIEQTNYPLTLAAHADEGLLLRLGHDRHRFDDATIRRMLEHLQTLLQGFVVDPNQRLSEVPLLTDAEQHQLLVEWNDTRTDYPRDRCLHQLLEAQVERTPDAVAVAYEGEELTYEKLNRRANQLAYHLRALGVGPEVVVGICMERSLDLVVGLFGILKAGGAYLPLDPANPRERLAFVLKDAPVMVVLTQERLLERLPEQAMRVICLDTGWETISQAPAENPASEVMADNLAYVIYTSGSTGKPKGTMIPHRGLVNYLTWCTQAYEVAEGRGAPVHSSIGFDLTITSLFAPLLVGRRVALLPEGQGGDPLRSALRKMDDFSFVKITPAHLEMLSQMLPATEVIGRTRRLIVGGEALWGEGLNFWQTHAPDTWLVNEYGPTETVVGCCTYEVPAGAVISGAVPIGRPIGNVQLYVLDRHLQPVPVGVTGELFIGGDGVGRGYLNRPDLTAERFIPDPFSPAPGARLYKTGDLARYRIDGNLEYLGRLDHQVKIRGFLIELGEIEAVIGQHPAVRQAVVLAREDVPGQKRLVAYVVSSQRQTLTLTDLRAFLKTALPDYMLPAAVMLLEAIPLTPNGKMDRQALPAPDKSRPDLEEAYVAPRTPVEQVLADIWADVLGIERVGVHDSFFELGGHSLLATQLVSRSRDAFQLELPLRYLFESPTVMGLATRIETIRWAAPRLREPQVVAGGGREEGEL